MENPQGGVVEVPPGDKPLVGLVNRRQGAGPGSQELHLHVMGPQLAKPPAQIADCRIVGVEQPSPGEEGMDEGVAE